MDNKISEFRVNFSGDSMRISNGIVSQIYTEFQALRLLNKDHILVGNENNMFSIHGYDMKVLHAAIENHWCGAV